MAEFERDQLIRELLGSSSSVELHVAQYFRVRKPWEEVRLILERNGLKNSAFDPAFTPIEVVEQMWEDQYLTEQGMFTFRPSVLVLGHTSESLEIPADQLWRMRQYFSDSKTGEMLPLTTNLGAPLIHSGSRGPQTYEIVNKGSETIEINIADMICVADVFQLKGPSLGAMVGKKGTFSTQIPGRIEIGKPKRW